MKIFHCGPNVIAVYNCTKKLHWIYNLFFFLYQSVSVCD